MATIPQFSSIGSNAAGVLDNGKNAKHYAYGVHKLNVNTTASNGVKFSTSGEKDNEGKISGDVEAKMSCKEIGLDFSEKWSTNNAIEVKAVLKDQGVKGVKVTTKAKFAEGDKTPLSGSVGASFANDLFATAVEVKANSGADYYASEVSGNLSMGQSGFVGGVSAKYDLSEGLKPVDVKLGYAADDFQATFLLNKNFTEFGVNYHQQVCNKLAVATQIDLKEAGDKKGAGASSVPVIEVGAVYTAAKGTTYRVKVDSNGNLGSVYSQDINNGVSVSFALGLDLTKDLASGSAGKAGFTLNFDA